MSFWQHCKQEIPHPVPRRGTTLSPWTERVPHLLLDTGGLYQGTPSGVPLVTANRAALAAALGDQGLKSLCENPVFRVAVLRKGTDLSVPKKSDNGARPLGPEG